MRCAHFLAWLTSADGVERRAHPRSAHFYDYAATDLDPRWRRPDRRDVGDRRRRTEVSSECEQVAGLLRRHEIDAADRPTGRFGCASTMSSDGTPASELDATSVLAHLGTKR
jgi:hypothetical protein